MSGTRPASHAGSWYKSSKSGLDEELSEYLSRVPDSIDGIGTLPPTGARVIIAPHAGYSYSGPSAAWAYKSLSLSPTTKRVFILGPAHHIYLDGCALTTHSTYATPLGPLTVDTATTSTLLSTGHFSQMTPQQDSDEHSIEMHLPYTYKILSSFFQPPSTIPPIVPILIGSINATKERFFAHKIAPYLRDPDNVFIVSSDFCHWGSRFSYQYYKPTVDGEEARSLSRAFPDTHPETEIWESIQALDEEGMRVIETGEHHSFTEYLKRTGNTICGRHPIGVMMAALGIVMEERRKNGDAQEEGKGLFKFVRYEQSSKCYGVRDSSVSYASAFAVL